MSKYEGLGVFFVFIFVILLLKGIGHAQDFVKPVNKICNINLVSDVEPDMTSLDSIIKDITKPGMTDEQKCLEAMKFVNEHRFWAPSLRTPGYGLDEGGTDLILLMNSTIPTICQQDAALCSILWMCMGYDVRYWQLKGHTTSEVKWGDKWRNLDATFPEVAKGSDGSIVGVIEGNKRYKPNISYIEKYDDFIVGHSMTMGLRKGENFTRYWGPISKDPDYWIPDLNKEMPHDKGNERRSLATIIEKKPYRFETQGCGYGNGLWVFVPDFVSSDWKDFVEYEENIRVPQTKEGYVKSMSPAKKGVIILKVYTPYLIDCAWIKGKCKKETNDSLNIYVSKNNGMNWESVWDARLMKTGEEKFNIPVRSIVRQELSYLVKIEIDGASAGFKDLRVETVVQVNPLSLPALKTGENSISFDAGEQTERITVIPEKNKFPELKNQWSKEIEKGFVEASMIKPENENALIIKVKAPGNIKKISWGGRFRKDAFQMSYSCDNKEWKKQEVSNKYIFPGTDAAKRLIAVYEKVANLPGDCKTIYLKMGTTNDWIRVVQYLRADVDYSAKINNFNSKSFPAGIKVKYCWVEEKDGKKEEKYHTEEIKSVPHKFKIKVEGSERPVMKWVKIEYGEVE
ncbi:MAG: hypothetical protein A2452_12285 [Candidatus Firestonebacteria bacterium RIFOXYC2_FULL_39_67]|nr:MAG: hypothetical protein A2536_07815 [Candidatus Firestonebacteria bacterium RIFOXYD2_FULL_39_29]OGF55626.1 MAG: hypothetical protein A2452_12285 [Candidatus Firestonebacteria bacterium RIFOXYC2_FULL_39_67]